VKMIRWLALNAMVVVSIGSVTMVASSARAEGLNLSWDDCGTHGVVAKNFACDTNTGVDVLVPSLVAPSCTPTEMSWTIQFQYGDNPNPDWWALGTGMCRSGSLVLTEDMNGMTACQNFWLPQNPGVLWTYSALDYGFNMSVLIALVPPAVPQHINSTTEIYLGRILIDHQKTVGAGVCGGGCGLRGSMSLLSVSIIDAVAGLLPTITQPASRQEVSWQFDYTPTRNRTWAEIKTLYR